MTAMGECQLGRSGVNKKFCDGASARILPRNEAVVNVARVLALRYVPAR
jgi:hypothetical protein